MSPHSKTVRGTLSNLKLPSTSTTKNPARLADPISLSTEKDDSVLLDSIPDISTNSPADPYRQNESLSPTSHASGKPHSARLRGTRDNSKGLEVNRTMLGDPVSLKAEMSESEWERGAGPDTDEEMREVARRRKEYEYKGRRGGRKIEFCEGLEKDS
ncbi:hypothetical protein K469DRAFT_688443 [Zopfia rhizophila CBS 207.26]|uniref:Uncharacterized protein n=1 Tax=Zopfia rhizophila CBS 207.26 TaxID=1314779 RepID=A0A6A6E2A1_9PEZI|nr:hypothetical protein K469DRAFT_688443 [Zopfia rhizophila CBS 207.26]